LDEASQAKMSREKQFKQMEADLKAAQDDVPVKSRPSVVGGYAYQGPGRLRLKI